MQKLTKLVLMLSFILSGALCHAHGVARTGNAKEEDIPIEVIEISSTTPGSGLHRGSSIIPTINGHILTVAFNENLGQVTVEIVTISGASVQCLSMLTPSGLQFYIPNAGDYIVTFTLPNGDEYYGEFTVTD